MFQSIRNALAARRARLVESTKALHANCSLQSWIPWATVSGEMRTRTDNEWLAVARKGTCLGKKDTAAACHCRPVVRRLNERMRLRYARS
jgi:hypothetical protein